MPKAPPFDSYAHPFNRYLNPEQRKQNAVVIGRYLLSCGWSFNAMAAALGNWEAECTLNPNVPTKNDYPVNRSGAFGLPQWYTWSSRYGAWCDARGIIPTATEDNPAARLEYQIEYHEYECRRGGGYWLPTAVNKYSWEEWKHSPDAPEVLAVAYYYEYERSGSGAGNRPNLARKWADYLKDKVYSLPAWLLFKFRR